MVSPYCWIKGEVFMRNKAIVFVLLFSLALNVAPVFAGLFDVPIEFRSINMDVASHYPCEDFIVIKDKSDLSRVVKACADESAIGRNISVPKIDFDKNMLIAVFGGRNTATSYSIIIDQINVIDDKVIVNVIKNGPQDAIDRPNVTGPYHMVLVPKTSLEVKFIIQGTPSPYSTADSLQM
jgi:hypothetical protein